MVKNSQIENLKYYFNSKENTLIINDVNDEISIFYIYVIKFYAKNYGMEIMYTNENKDIYSEVNLFETKSIYFFKITNPKKLEVITKDLKKKIIFTDYKNFKKMKNKIRGINGYLYQNDIEFFIQKELKINNQELLIFCKNNPNLFYSEISKYLINQEKYISDQALSTEKNHILDIRKSNFEIKKKNFNIKNLYFNLKKEALYKKLNFLTY